MRAYSLTQLGDRELLTALKSLVVQDRATIAALLAHIAETDSRRLYLPAGYPSMFEYCVRGLRMPEYAALKRIRAARTARQFPAIFAAVAEGRLHLTAVVLLKPCLTPDNADELLAAATHKTQAEIERLLAERYPKADLPGRVEIIAPAPSQTSPELLSAPTVTAVVPTDPLAVRPVTHSPTEQLAARPVAAPFPRVKPLSPQRFAVQFTIDQSTHDDLQCVRALLGHQIPSGDIAQVFGCALKLLKRELEKKKFGATDRPRTGPPRAAAGTRTIPTHVKREVWARDQGQCTFVGDNGKRCPARNRLEIDHIVPVARGGQATVEGTRLLCRAHNQFEAERTFGDGFMHEKREAARSAARRAKQDREPKQLQRAQQAREAQQAEDAKQAQARASAAEVVPWLRALGLRADESRRAAALAETIAGAPLEERVRLALKCFGPRSYSQIRAATSIWRAATSP